MKGVCLGVLCAGVGMKEIERNLLCFLAFLMLNDSPSVCVVQYNLFYSSMWKISCIVLVQVPLVTPFKVNDAVLSVGPSVAFILFSF